MTCSKCGATMTPLLPQYLLPPLCLECIRTPAPLPPPTAEPVEFRELVIGQLGLFGQVGNRR